MMPPQALFTTTAAAQSQYRDKSAFQGKFQISVARHIGNFRQPDASAWVSVFNAFAVTS
jgi:hypothetical protein